MNLNLYLDVIDKNTKHILASNCCFKQFQVLI
jgi:hypothetical protein